MHASLLDILRCPFCGSRLSIVENDALVREGDRIEVGVLGCECCAFPIVAGIPVMIADETTRHALQSLEAGRCDEALIGLMGLSDDPGRRERFRAFLTQEAATYREALELLCDDAEGTYFLYRLTDPTYVAAEALLRAIGQLDWPVQGRTLDLCGGSGHLTRALTRLQPPGATLVPGAVLADVYFWKLWLARRFTSPDCGPVCCDANHPLPFARDTFSTVLRADAFPYIWHKRLLAEEMMRLAGSGGVVVMPHVHSALGDNFSAGDTLSPAAYYALFEPHPPRLFSDERLFDDVVEHGGVDLTRDVSPELLGSEPSFTLVASARADLFRRYERTNEQDVTGELLVNPLYRVERSGESSVLTLTFPTPEYEAEFRACRRYLPDQITVVGDLTGPIVRETLGPQYEELRNRRVLIDAPVGYC
ncbi:MAG: hypothetical protein VX815_02650 [Gemmatimonadota bacterium]|nr:hypothetical protein [Gemmatimonadota bacterium]